MKRNISCAILLILTATLMSACHLIPQSIKNSRRFTATDDATKTESGTPETNETTAALEEQTKALEPKNAPLNGNKFLKPASGGEESNQFDTDDLYIEKDGAILPMASTLDDVLAFFGEPMNYDEINAITADAKAVRLEYSFAQIDVVLNERPQTISSVTLRDNTVAGPRGLRVGNTLDEILAVFPHDQPEEKQEIQYLYRGNEQYPDLPSRGRILYDDTGEVPIYAMFDFPITPYTFDDPQDFILQSHACLSYTIADGVIISINLSVGPYVE